MNTLNLNFTKIGDYFTAEFKAEGDFSIHIEQAEATPLYFGQKSIENGNYELLTDSSNGMRVLTADFDVQGFLPPKWIQVKAITRPSVAVVLSESNLTAI